MAPFENFLNESRRQPLFFLSVLSNCVFCRPSFNRLLNTSLASQEQLIGNLWAVALNSHSQ